MTTLRDASRKDWRTNSQSATESEINCGSLQRIADASELMAKRHKELIEENERLRRDLDNYRRWYHDRERRIVALKGWITRLKRERQA